MPAMLLILLTAPPTAAPADTVVVCPAVFREALGPWLEYRVRQGHRLAVVSNSGSPEEICRRIRGVARRGRLRFVVLVGDAELGAERDTALRARCVPTHYAKAKVNVLWGSEAYIATDNGYADLERDSGGGPTPELAVGRLTADTPEQLRQIVAKILAYERSSDFGPWRRRLDFVAGVGGFGPLAEMVIESTARFFLTVGIPPDYQMSMTYASWRSPYCPDPRLFQQTTLRRLNEGSWFWVYIGHGHHLELDRLRVPDGRYPILGVADLTKLKCEHGTPIALFLACYSGAFDGRADCLAERMLCQPGGPVAVVAGSRVTMPYAMAVLAGGLMDQCFRRRCPTLGEAVLRAKQEMMKAPRADDPRRAMLDALAKVISPAPEKLAAERAEHLLLFNLLGDPLLRLRYPKPIRLDVPAAAAAGGSFSVSGSCPIEGRGTVELVVRRDRLTFKPPARHVYPQTSGGLAEFQETYQRANDRCWKSVEVTIDGGRFAARLDVPQEAGGTCHVRVFITGPDDFAMGAANVTIEKKAADF